ncbi:8168_t:CDS:1, partial [Dentiscutata erythropus]
FMKASFAENNQQVNVLRQEICHIKSQLKEVTNLIQRLNQTLLKDPSPSY